VGASTVVFACSYSGNTEETLSAYGQAKGAGARIICITSGGELARLARADGTPLVEIAGGLPPRAALGYSTIALFGALQAIGIAEGLQNDCNEAIQQLSGDAARYGIASPERENPAKAIASSLHGKIVAVYGSAGFLESAAVRWRGQIEENAKNLAFHHVLPEMNHNELVGWRHPAALLQNLGVIFLRDREDHPQVQRRFELTAEALRSRARVVHELWTEGACRLARVLSIVYLGDFVSLYLAYLNGVDPTPVEAIETFKAKLSEAART
jgi:glucose/mannose-6-phosphate isomerase